MTVGFAYQFNLASAVTFAGGGLGETLIRSDGTVAAGGGTSQAINVTPTVSGTYYLSIASAYGGTGSYTLSAMAADDYTGDFSTTGAW